MKNSFHKVTFNLISELKLLNHLQILYKKVRKLSLSPRKCPAKRDFLRYDFLHLYYRKFC